MPSRALYSCYDFRLSSELLLGELTPAGEGETTPVVEIRMGSLPERLAGSAAEGQLQVAGADALLTIDAIGRFLMRGGREIVVDPAPGVSERNLRLFLLGSALGIICHQRGLLPLHANAVIIGGAAVAFAGPSGSGKSTLAAYFARSGYPVLCDDVCVVSFDEAGQAHAWPGLPRLKLWSEAAAAFGHDPTALERVMDGQDKFHVPLARAGQPQPVPLRRIYLLTKAGSGEPGGMSRLRGHQAMTALMEQTYRDACLAPMGLAGQNFRHCAALLDQVEIWEARRAWGYDVFAEEVRLLEEHLLASA
jgi:hypothetical protein